VSKYGSILKLLRTGTLALPFKVGPANNTRGFRSTDGPHPHMCLFGRSADRPRPGPSAPTRKSADPGPRISASAVRTSATVPRSHLEIPIPDPFSQSRDSGLEDFESRDPGGIMGSRRYDIKNRFFGTILLNLRFLSQRHRPMHLG